jgi:hypothetical protein
VSLRRHGQLDATLATLTRLGTIDAALAAFLAAAVKSRCNIIVTGGVNCGKTTFRLGRPKPARQFRSGWSATPPPTFRAMSGRRP